jgi:hypothetical protein
MTIITKDIKLKVLIISLSVAAVFFAIFSNSYKAKAQQNNDEQGLSISPVVFELNANAGDTISNQIKIYNTGTTLSTIEMNVEDFAPIGEEGEVVLEDAGDNAAYSIAKWTSIDTKKFELNPKEQKVITFSIKVPANAEPGSHYGSISALVSGAVSSSTGSSVSTKRGALVLIRVAGSAKEQILVDTFKSKNSFYETGPVDFEVKFKNSGNVHLKPAGFITITDMLGKQVAQLDIPQNNVIPGAIRQAPTTWDTNNLFGNYTATLVANYGTSSKQTITSVTSFVVIPWKLILGIFFGIALITLLIIRSKKRLGKAFKVLLSQD